MKQNLAKNHYCEWKNSCVSTLHSNEIVFIRRRKVEEITGLSRSSIYAQMADGTFPKNVEIGPKSVRWVQAEVTAWCQNKLKFRK